MRSTIKDVAAKSGFSTATVSMVLNNKDSSISAKTREIIRQCAKELNYHPNRLAYGMAKSCSNVFGLILPDKENYFFYLFTQTVQEIANQSGYNLIVCNSDSTSEKDIELINLLIDHGVDGIILASANISSREDTSAYDDLLNSSPIPIIHFDRIFKNTQSFSAHTNNFIGGYLATRHLINYGHTRIGCITGPKGLPAGQERLRGYQAALSESGIPYQEALVYFGKYDIRTGQEALSFLLGQNVSAVFAFADIIAIGLYKQASIYNIRIPDDLSVVGFDDIFLSEFINPPLTTVAQPVADIARSLVSKLIRLTQDRSLVYEPETFKPFLKVRGSTRRIETT